MYQHEVSITSPCGLKRLTGPLRDDMNLDPGRLREQRQNTAEKPGVLNRGGRCGAAKTCNGNSTAPSRIRVR
jgi:hypothetical protein